MARTNVSNFKLYVGKFALAEQLMSEGIKPLRVSANPLEPNKRIWTFSGNRKIAFISKKFYDDAGLEYSNSLKTLLHLLDQDEVSADER